MFVVGFFVDAISTGLPAPWSADYGALKIHSLMTSCPLRGVANQRCRSTERSSSIFHYVPRLEALGPMAGDINHTSDTEWRVCVFV